MSKKHHTSSRSILNIGNVIFFVIFLYLTICVVSYLGKEKIQFYEVAEGGIVNDKTYKGLILRDEQVKTTDQAGYINYYLPEGRRASVGTRVYSIDETGNLKSLLDDASEESGSLTEENYSDLRKQISSFVLAFDNDNFSTVYDSRYSLESAVMEYANFSTLDKIDELANQAGVVIKQVSSDAAGVVSFHYDSYEAMQPEDVTQEMFQQTAYSKQINQAGTRIDSGSFAYKVIPSSKWSILFPLTEEDQSLYADKKCLSVHFPDYNLTLTGDYSTLTGADGNTFGKLDFPKYMEEFLSDRFINFEVIINQTSGLKIPVSSVTEKEFYLLPLSYKKQDEETGTVSFYKEVYTENGTSTEAFTPEIYAEDEEDAPTQYAYIEISEDSVVQKGDYIVNPDTNERYQVGATGNLKGVYNINKGYTVFKRIEILDSNSEYYTVKKGTPYGLTVYDHIVLDASLVTDDQILYQ